MNSHKTHELLKRSSDANDSGSKMLNHEHHSSIYHNDDRNLAKEMINTEAVIQMVKDQK